LPPAFIFTSPICSIFQKKVIEESLAKLPFCAFW